MGFTEETVRFKLDDSNKKGSIIYENYGIGRWFQNGRSSD